MLELGSAIGFKEKGLPEAQLSGFLVSLAQGSRR